MAGWFDVASETELVPGQAKLVDVDNVLIAVFNLDGEYHAIEDVCTHDGSPMLGCGLEPEQVIDGARFCVKTGDALTPPAYEPTTTFPVRVENGMVQVTDDRWD
jgi:3-phenylpropionate/trans-cinnamate dioxygenase ferredoxin component